MIIATTQTDGLRPTFFSECLVVQFDNVSSSSLEFECMRHLTKPFNESLR